MGVRKVHRAKNVNFIKNTCPFVKNGKRISEIIIEINCIKNIAVYRFKFLLISIGKDNKING